MKKIMLLLIIMLSLCIHADNVNVLFVIPNQYGANTFLYLEKLNEMGWEITTTAVSASVSPCFWGTTVSPDSLISDIVDVTTYDCVIIAPMKWSSNPANAFADLINSPEMMDLLVAANDANLVLFASCAGPRVFAAAGILNGVNVAAQSYYQTELIGAGAIFVGAQIPAVIDGNIVTGTRGQYYWQQNIEAVKTAFENIIATRSEVQR
jgi:putative intracellular protease/amidase